MARGMNVTVVRSKICGITRIEDALAAVEAGADAIGLVFYGKSPRAVSIEQAAAIVQALPPFVTSVGLFVDMPRDELQQLLQRLPLDLLQFHGDESPADCEGHGRPYIKALRVRPGKDVAAAMAPYAGARGILLDTFVEGVPGVRALRSIGRWCRKMPPSQSSWPAAWMQAMSRRLFARCGPMPWMSVVG